MKAKSIFGWRGLALIASLALSSSAALAVDLPPEIAAPGMSAVIVLNAVGAQLYACLPQAKGGAPKWVFREPIATLLLDGRTVGRHFAGPSWELDDGSLVKAKVAASAPGATAEDIPLLKLDATSATEVGWLKGVTVVQRVATKGGVKSGPCQPAGALVAEPYSADYIFLRPQ